jgi:hypothetical protein
VAARGRSRRGMTGMGRGKPPLEEPRVPPDLTCHPLFELQDAAMIVAFVQELPMTIAPSHGQSRRKRAEVTYSQIERAATDILKTGIRPTVEGRTLPFSLCGNQHFHYFGTSMPIRGWGRPSHCY